MSGELAVRALLTYLLHSTVLLAAAALVRHALGESRLPLQEALLRAALVGAFATSALQLGLELKPLGGVLALPAPAVAGPARSASESATAGEAMAPARAPGPVRPEAARPGTALLPPPARELPWRRALTLAWGTLAALALLRLAVAAWRLRHLLRGREPILDARLAPQVAILARALGLRPPVRLSTAPKLAVPLATGVLWPEVCLPTRAVVELGPDEQLALCAHELAHVARRDPAWILLARLAEAVAPLQPLNGWARRRLQELSECLSDDLAVAASARPVGLARSLVDVASWSVAERSVLPAAAAGALGAHSRLGHRVERLMNPFRPLERPGRSLLPLAAAAVLATALVMPVVSATASPGAAVAAQAQPTAAPAAPAEVAPAEVAPAEAAPAEKAPVSSTSGPAASAQTRAELERQIEALGRQIEKRARLHEGEMKALDQQLQALTARLQPNGAELERLGREMEAAAQELAAAATEHGAAALEHRAVAGEGAARQADAARRMAELQQQMRAQVKTLDTAQARALSEQARAIGERARPSEQELAELRRLSRELARVSLPEMQEISRQTHEAMEQARRAMLEVAEAMRRAVQETSRAVQETSRAVQETSRAGETVKQRE